MKSLYELTGVGMRYGASEVLRGVNLVFAPGEFAAIAGPNGAGKTTLAGIMAGVRQGYSGSCRFEQREIRSWSRKNLARSVSVVPQSLHLDFGFTAEQIVMMGRTPFGDGLFESELDCVEVERAMALTGVTGFRNRDFRFLSGGERQRVILAAALCQSPRVLLLDEPATFLDIEHQILLYRLLHRLSEEGVLVVTVTHDLNLAGTYAGRLILLRSGVVAADGSPGDVLNADMIKGVFQVAAHVGRTADGRSTIRYDP